MNAFTKTVNICEKFFSSTAMAPTSERIAQIPPTIKEAHHSLSTVLVHEMTHTKWALRPVSGAEIARDYA